MGSPDSEAPGSLEAAAQRLANAIGRLEKRIDHLSAAGSQSEPLPDRRVAAETGPAATMARDLEAAAVEAAAALDRAIIEMRSILGAGEP
ncbi:MAG TPA: hypothetical protein VGS12_11340 [Caulobacteraceae bacterium]|nr:hypothetical protein [Caulobacteraceae bacterium]